MDENNTSPRKPEKSKSSRLVKLIFLLTLAGVLITVWVVQNYRGLPLNWPDDFNAAIRQAKQEDRRLLVLFVSSSPNEEARKLAKITLVAPENAAAIEKGSFLKVKVETDLKSDIAEKYKITTLPTMLILSPDGRELNRREGYIPQSEFTEEFLSLKKIQAPKTVP